MTFKEMANRAMKNYRAKQEQVKWDTVSTALDGIHPSPQTMDELRYAFRSLMNPDALPTWVENLSEPEKAVYLRKKFQDTND